MNGFEIAESVRYVDDIKLKHIKYNSIHIKKYEADLALNSIKISEDITPEIYKSLEEVCKNLKIDINSVSAYVTSSPDIQATVRSNDKNNCVVTLTSAIVNLLDFEEMKFIIGHEIGHFLLSHNIEERMNENSHEGFIKSRGSEISVDRIGLLACKDFDVAMRSIIKTLSGLNQKYISFNIRGFLRQLEKAETLNDISNKFSTHPAFVLRVKALFRFSLSDPCQRIINKTKGTNLIDIDKLIQKDLNKYIDQEIRNDIKESKENILFWGYAYSYIKNESLSKENQADISNKFGELKKDKLINMIKGQSTKAAINNVYKKLLLSLDNFRKVAPNKAKKEINTVLMTIEKETKNQGFFDEVNKNI